MRAWLNRQRSLADYTLSALARRRGKNLALLAVYAIVVFTIASAMLFATALKREAAVVLAEAPELTVQQLRMGRHEMIDSAPIAELAAIRGVTGVEGRLWGYFYDASSGANYTFQVPGDSALIPGPGEVLVGEGVQRARGAT